MGTRERLLENGAALFAAKGFHGVGVEELGESCKLSQSVRAGIEYLRKRQDFVRCSIASTSSGWGLASSLEFASNSSARRKL